MIKREQIQRKQKTPKQVKNKTDQTIIQRDLKATQTQDTHTPYIYAYIRKESQVSDRETQKSKKQKQKNKKYRKSDYIYKFISMFLFFYLVVFTTTGMFT